MPLERITVFCFGASYATALILELAHLLWPRRLVRLIGLAFGAAGLLAQTIYLACHPPALSSQSGSLLFLAWVLAVFYLYGTVHYRRLVWGVFVLPVIVGLVAWSGTEPASVHSPFAWAGVLDQLRGQRFWRVVHSSLLLLGAVGVCVGFVASLMYLIQARRLRAKVPPDQGLRLLSLERLEEMNRRAVNVAFPLLTAGVGVGVALMGGSRPAPFTDWLDPKILATVGLWLVFAIVVYLRYGYQVRGRRVALLTILAFVLLMLTLAASHTSVQGGRG
jgi:ABC-type transport system involved in cytochrome c biogenesis permease subunit